MTDEISTRLKAIVERVVRPVTATRERKRAMREELLAHVTSVFEDEQAKSGDDAAALAQTRARFGDAGQLTAEFQSSISRLGRREAKIQDFCNYYLAPGHSLPRYLAVHAGLVLVMFAGVFILVHLTEYQKRGHAADISVAFNVALIPTMITAPFLLLMAMLPSRWSPAVFGTAAERSWPFVILFFVSTLMAFPLLAFIAYWLGTHDFSASLRQFWIGCLFAPLGPLVFYVAGRETYNEIRYDAEWGSLRVDE